MLQQTIKNNRKKSIAVSKKSYTFALGYKNQMIVLQI